MNREWTGSVAVLPEAMRKLAVEMMERGHDDNDTRPMNDASTLAEWADAIEQLYARLDATTRCAREHSEPVELPNAQLLTLGRIAAAGGPTYAYLGGLSLPDDYIGVTSPAFPNGGCGIAPDGSVSS